MGLLIARNPAEMVSLPRRTAREMHTWNSDELRRFLEFARASRMYPAVLVLATTGMRRSEALGLCWRALDLDAGRLEVTQTLVMVGASPTLTPEAKTAHARRSIASTTTLLRYYELTARLSSQTA